MSKEDGGSAFPRAPFEYCDQGTGLEWGMKEQRGMTLRDWFAGMALQGLIACPETSSGTNADFAEWAFSQADAVLEAREK